ncbi:MAG: hypothetical protein AB8E82_17960 [Aureispira sp.]
MKPTVVSFSQSKHLIALLITLLFLCSFSAVPIQKKPRLTKQEQRLQKKRKRLQKQLEYYNTRPTLHLKRQQKLQQQLAALDDDEPNNKLSILSLIAGVLTPIPFFFAVVFALIATFGGAGFMGAMLLFLLCAILGLTATIWGFMYKSRSKKMPKKYPKRGRTAATFGIILGIPAFLLAILFFAFIAFFEFNQFALFFVLLSLLIGIVLLVMGIFTLTQNQRDPKQLLNPKREGAIISIIIGSLLLLLGLILLILLLRFVL